MKKFPNLFIASALLLALMAISTTVSWAQTAKPTQNPTTAEQWRQQLKDKQAQMVQQRANPALRQTKAKVAAPAVVNTKKGKELEAQKMAETQKNTTKTAIAKTPAKPVAVLSPEQRLAQIEKDLAYIRNTGKSTEKLAKLEAEQANLYRSQLSKATTKADKIKVLQAWTTQTTDPATKTRLQASINRLQQP